MESELVTRSKPINGRVWKKVHTAKNCNMKNKLLGQGWNKRLEQRKQHEILQMIVKERKDALNEEKVKKAQHLEQRRKQREANELKAQVVQQVSSAKARRLSKKQFSKLRKN